MSSPARAPLRAVLFDLDDTLCDDLGSMERCIRATAARAAERLPDLCAGRLADAYLALADAYWTSVDLVNPPSIAVLRAGLWRQALKACGQGSGTEPVLDEMTALYGRLRRTGVRLFPDALPALERLRASGCRLGLVTNGVSETHTEKLAVLGLRDRFDAVLMPDAVGYAKPDPRIFAAACRMLGVAPGETAHVGDSLLLDVGGAKGAGLLAIWYNPHGRPLPSGGVSPHAQVRALAEVAALAAASR